MNGQYIARLPLEALDQAVRPLLAQAGLAHARLLQIPGARHRLLELLQPRARRLTDFVEQAAPLLSDTVEYDPAAVDKHLTVPDMASHLTALAAALHTVTPFDESHVEAAVRGTAERRSLKAGVLIHATRVALTGRTTSPGLFEVITLLGRDESVTRLERLAAFLVARSGQIPQQKL